MRKDYCCAVADEKIEELFKIKDVSKQEEIVDLVDKLYYEKRMTKSIKQICEIAITRKYAKLCYQLAKILRWEDIVNDLQTVVLEDKNAILCYLFARDVEHANVKELQKVVVDSNEALWCCMFASFVKGAKIKPLQQIVIKSRDVEVCRYFANVVKKANKKALYSVTAPCDVEKNEKELNSLINE